MKITLEIDQDLLARTRRVAQSEGTTLHALIEEGLRVALARRDQKIAYRWPDLSVGGDGIAPEIEEGSWETLRDKIYRGVEPDPVDTNLLKQGRKELKCSI